MNTQNEVRTFYSTNDEEFRLDDVCEVMQQLDDEGELEEGRNYFSCEFRRVDPAQFMRADCVIEIAGDRIYDECGEGSEDAFLVSRDASDELDLLLNAWVQKHITGRFWTSQGKSQEFQVTADDIAEYRNEKPTVGEGGGEL